jgi:hypothetical protein
MVGAATAAPVRTVSELGDDHGAEAEVVRRGALDSSDDLRKPPGQVVDTHVGVEEIAHDSAELWTRFDVWRFGRIRELLGRTREGEKPLAERPWRFLEHDLLPIAMNHDFGLPLEAIGARESHGLAPSGLEEFGAICHVPPPKSVYIRRSYSPQSIIPRTSEEAWKKRPGEIDEGEW